MGVHKVQKVSENSPFAHTQRTSNEPKCKNDFLAVWMLYQKPQWALNTENTSRMNTLLLN